MAGAACTRPRSGRPRPASCCSVRRRVGARTVLASHDAEVHVFEVRLHWIEFRSRPRLGVYVDERTARLELGADHAMMALDRREVCLRDDAAPHPPAERGDGGQWFGLEQNLSLVDD